MEILVDSSVWIDYFNGRRTAQTSLFEYHLDHNLILLGDLILVEILQGFTREKDFAQAQILLRDLPVETLLGPERAVQAAKNYRLLRRKGITVRKTIDVIIASYCVAESLPLLYSDRDFDPMVKHLGLKKVA